MKKYLGLLLICFLLSPMLMGIADTGDSCTASTSVDTKDALAQEALLEQGQAQTGMPAVTNFQEKKLLKLLYELRDKANVQTYTYIVAENTGKLILLGRSIGYGIPYATEYSNPQKIVRQQSDSHYVYEGLLPQAEPNGLFPPADAEGTWVFLVDPKGDIKPTYIEPRVIVSQFPLTSAE